MLLCQVPLQAPKRLLSIKAETGMSVEYQSKGQTGTSVIKRTSLPTRSGKLGHICLLLLWLLATLSADADLHNVFLSLFYLCLARVKYFGAGTENSLKEAVKGLASAWFSGVLSGAVPGRVLKQRNAGIRETPGILWPCRNNDFGSFLFQVSPLLSQEKVQTC